MRKKLMLLTILNCAAGGWFLTPASATIKTSLPRCDDLVGGYCDEGTIQFCETANGGESYAYCDDHNWWWG